MKRLYIFVVSFLFCYGFNSLVAELTTFPQDGYVMISQDDVDPAIPPCKDILSIGYQQDAVNAYFQFTVNCDSVGFNNNRFFLFIDSDGNGNSDYVLWMENPQQILLYEWDDMLSEWADTGSPNTGFEDPNASPDDHIFMGVALADINITDGAGIGASAAPANFQLDVTCREPACQGFDDVTTSWDFGCGNATVSPETLCGGELVTVESTILDTTCYYAIFDWIDPYDNAVFQDIDYVSGDPGMVYSSFAPDNTPGYWRVIVTYYNDLDEQLPSTAPPEIDELFIYVNEKPSVSFSYSPDSILVSEPVQFISMVGGGTSPFIYAWSFGDSETSNDQNPIHTYSSTGDFEVVLTATDDNGCSDIYTDFVTVLDCCTPLEEVRNVSALKVDENSTQFYWSAVTDSCHSIYKILRTTDPTSPSNFSEVGQTSETNYNDFIASGMTYYYKIVSSGCNDFIGPF